MGVFNFLTALLRSKQTQTSGFTFLSYLGQINFLGLFLFVACFGYLAFSFTGLLMPQYLNTVARFANIAILGEAPIIFWLAIMGAKPKPPGAVASSPTAG